MKKICILLAGVLVGFVFTNGSSQTISNSQVEITYTNPDNLKACSGDDTLFVNVENISGQPFDPGSQISIQFPDGVNVLSIVSPDYTFLSFAAGTNTYTYSNSTVHNAAAETKIKLVIEAECPIYELLDNTSGSTLDINSTIDFDYAISATSYNLSGTTLSYNVAQANIKTTVSAFNLTITIPNDYDPFNQEVRYDIAGNSSLDEFSLYLDLPVGLNFNGIDSVKVNGVNVTGYSTPTLISGSTYSTTLNAVSLGLTNFATGDVVLVYYNYTPDCLNSVQINYYTSIDCFGSACFFEADLGFVNLFQAPPLINFTASNNSDADYCGATSQFELVLINEDPSGYTMYNPQLTLILYNLNSYSNFMVNGETIISGLPVATTGTLFINLNSLQSSSGFVLNDYNGDGNNGEIAPGDTVVITFDLLLDPSKLENCPGEFIGNQIYGYLTYKQSSCVASPIIMTTPFYDTYYNYNQAPPSINVTGAVLDGSSQTIEFCVDRYIAESFSPGGSLLVLDDFILFGADIVLPCGMTLSDPTSTVWEFASGSTIPVSTSSTSLGGATLVQFQSTPGQIPIVGNEIEGCLIFETEYACDTCSSPASITFNGFGTFADCPAVHSWTCESVSFCTDCEPAIDCSVEGKITHSNFVVNRTSFGWTNSTMTTKVTQADVNLNPSNYNTVGAYACDTIHVLLEGEICGGADDFTPYITFEKPTAITASLLNLVSAEITINSTTSPISIATSADLSTYWAIEFQTQSGPYVNGTALKLEAVFVVSKPVISSAPFPYHLVSEFSGAFFTNTQWIGGASPATPAPTTFFDFYGEECLYPEQDFNFYKVIQYIQEPVSALNCGVNTETVKLRLGYQGGTSGDEFPNEFRPFNIFVDSIVYELTNPLNIGNVFAASASIGSTPLSVTQVGGLITLEPTSGNWPVIDKTNFNNYYSVEIEFDINCGNTVPVTLFDNYIHYENFFYSDNACNDAMSVSNTFNHLFNTPNINFTFLNPVQDAFTPTADFDFSVSNTSFFGTNYPYMLITYDPLLVSVTVPGLTYYSWSANQVYVEIGTLAGFATINDMITVTPLNCDVEQVTEVIVESGLHCAGYPSTPGTFVVGDYCPDQIDTLQLTILKSNLNVDLFTSFSPDEPVDHCDGKFSVLLQVYNDEKADISDLALQFSSIPGLTLLSTSYYYPIPQGQSYDPFLFNWSMVDPMDFTVIPAATGTALQTGYTFYNDGLDASATLNGILANDGINLYNFYHIKLDFIVDCDFDVSEELAFVVSAFTNCSEPITITTNTFIDFIPPADNLEITMNVEGTACDPLDKVADVFVQVYNGDTTVYDSLYVDLYCDTDNNGLFDPDIDLFLSSQPLYVGLSTTINPGQTAATSFSTSVLSGCPNGVYIATIATQDGCYCNFNYTIDSTSCCECSIEGSTTTSADNIIFGIDAAYYYSGFATYNYYFTNLPSPLRNYTFDPNHPTLYVYNPEKGAWVYPSNEGGYTEWCTGFYFNPTQDTLFTDGFQTNILPLPHVFDFKVVYPDVDQYGDTCGQYIPQCVDYVNKDQNPDAKNFCPWCAYEDDSLFCAGTNQFEYNTLAGFENSDQWHFDVYPNPFSDKFVIQSAVKVEEVEIIDEQGRIVARFSGLGLHTIEIDLGNVAKGIYILKVTDSEGHCARHRVVKS